MGDLFKEQLVKKTKTTRDIVTTLSLVGAAIAAILGVSLLASFPGLEFIGSISVFLFMGIIFGAYYLNNQFKKEYEYIFTNGELDVDCIINQAKRKRVFTFDLRDIEVLVHSANIDYINELKAAEVVLDFSSGKINHDTYYILLNYKGKKTKVIIDPNENMIQSFSAVISPRKLIKRK